MSDKPQESGPRIHVDDDWKTEAAREKAELAEETADVGTKGPLPDPSFAEIINMIAMQAVVGLGGMAMPDGQRIPPDLNVAKHHIDMLDLLSGKTEGNLSEKEQRLLDTVLYDLRMRFVQTAKPEPGHGDKPAGQV